MNIVFFGSGSPIACYALEALIGAGHPPAAVVVPRPARGWRRLVTNPVRVVRTIAEAHHIPIVLFGDFVPQSDLICVASFPRILRHDILKTARLGAINVHQSLLPRHRGADPIFWTFFEDEQVSGVTVHWIDGGVDSGDIIAQRRVQVSNATGMELYLRLAAESGAVLTEAVNAIAAGTATRTPQNEALATSDPAPAKRTWRIPWDEWTSERVARFLRGVVFPSGLWITDRDGESHLIGPLIAHEPSQHPMRPGRVRIENRQIAIECRDGIVRATRLPFLARLRARRRRAP